MNAFHPVIHLPREVEVFDFTAGYDADRARGEYGIGRYDEKRPGMYDAALFGGVRNVHMGIDLGAPPGTEVFAYDDGIVWGFADNAAEGDYGPTLVTQHRFDHRDLWVLLGHLSRRSLEGKVVGQRIARGERIAWVGEKHENGGWNPHIHVQLAWTAPARPDLPGVVSDTDREAARLLYPDPRMILGAIYR